MDLPKASDVALRSALPPHGETGCGGLLSGNRWVQWLDPKSPKSDSQRLDVQGERRSKWCPSGPALGPVLLNPFGSGGYGESERSQRARLRPR